MRLNDAILGGLVLALGLAILIGAQGLPEMPGQNVGPALFPSIIGWGFVVCGGVIGARGLRTWAAGPAISVADWLGGGRKIAAGAWLVGGLVVYIAAFDGIGFIPLSVIYTGGLMWILGVRAVWAAVWSLGATVVVFEVFTRMLYVPLPSGLLGHVG